MRSKIVIGAAILVLLVVNWSIYQKERHLGEGKIVYLELAPVDPRSLMQGDYMALNFKIADEIAQILPRNKKSDAEDLFFDRDYGLETGDGRIVVSLDGRSVADFIRLENGAPPGENELYMRYRVRNGNIKFATNAFYFQEGHAEFYENARYGQFRVDSDGELLLTYMYDENLRKLEPEDIEADK